MSEGKIFYCLEDKRCFLKLTGKISYKLSYSFDEAINNFLEKKKIEKVLIDLRGAEYIDSTNLGLLAKIAIKLKERDEMKPVLLSTKEDINIILESVGFFDVFLIIDSSEVINKDYERIAALNESEREDVNVILKAHQTLTQLNNQNKSSFQDVVELLKKESKNLEENDNKTP